MSPILQTSRLTIRFEGLVAVDDVDLAVQEGERRLLLGPNGAGKTTLFNLITGDLMPTSGAVEFKGADVTHLPPRKRAAKGMARTYQILTLFPNDTLVRNVSLALLAQHSIRWNPFASLSVQRDILDEAQAVLDRLGLGEYSDMIVREASYGVRRRLEIAIALAQKPKLLLLDEPLGGLSAQERSEVQTLIKNIDRAITVIMIEHDVDTALELADRVTLMHFGKVVVEGNRREVAEDQRTKEIYLGH